MGLFSRFLKGKPMKATATRPAGQSGGQPVAAARARATTPGTAASASSAGGGIARPAERAAATIMDVAELPFFREKLYDEIGVRHSLRHEICPVQLQGGAEHDKVKVFALIVVEHLVNSDVAEEIARLLKEKGFTASTPLFYPASTQVLVELARDAVMENHPQNKAAMMGLSLKDRSALWQQFCAAVSFAMENQASDIHIEIETASPKSQILFRVDGRLTRPREFNLKSSTLTDMVAYLYNMHGKSGSDNGFNMNMGQACRISERINGRQVLFRWASNQTSKGCKVVMRMLYQDSIQTIRTLIELGYLPDQIDMWNEAIARLGGGTVISGVVGSGKSTTIQTVMTMLPDWMARYTVEDPVEYDIPGAAQFSVSRGLSEEGRDPFIVAKRQLKRMDPDAVLVGEIRDKESAGLFRDIAESGHRAFATVHAPSAIDIITLRLVSDELGIPRDVIATPGFLNLLIYQALLPVTCTNPDCRLCARDAITRGVVTREYIDNVKRLFDIDPEKMFFRNPDGCHLCRREGLPELNGARGRTVIAEMIELDSTMLSYARDPTKNLELKCYVRSLNRARYDEPSTRGKTVLEVAMYKVSIGMIDPREVEAKFGSFQQYERERAITGKEAEARRLHVVNAG
ncbi:MULTISPECIES: GspE/PulE family protein [unclassified Burkholderia]|uniref:GspE/PulE family protein n=1 Tax=unclassified Burkholderia TaxID=2613784 RepID=UPI002AAF2BA8|nr:MULTISPECIES: ATPase, T2SS/T4P/T4SS family [unclassified Burkholderia]